ncbi:DNA replication licensing factor, mcm4 component [Branchiostoma belcheri]|nr:DNA replication licensing factor, mcm4 component [Branchiostoma belcheri]
MSSPRSTRSTPRRGAQKRGRGGDDTPSRRSTRSSRSTEPSSPPAALDSSPGGSLAPLPSSPPSQEQRQNVADTSLFSSPAASRAGPITCSRKACANTSNLSTGHPLPYSVRIPDHPSHRLAGQLRPLPGGWHEEPDVRGFRGWEEPVC